MVSAAATAMPLLGVSRADAKAVLDRTRDHEQMILKLAGGLYCQWHFQDLLTGLK
jgi:hypothetical protein